MKRWWLIIIFGLPITYFLALGMWGMVYRSVVRIPSSSHEVSATMEWWKDNDVYGTNPAKRIGGPYDVKISRYDNTSLNFKVEYFDGGQQTCLFKGKRDEVSGKFCGTWKQVYPQDGGKWFLNQKKEKEKLLIGKYRDKSGEWTNFSLTID